MSGSYAKARRGSDHYKAILTEDDVRIIRAAAEERARLRAEASRLSNLELAFKFGVGKKCIERIVARQTWSHV